MPEFKFSCPGCGQHIQGDIGYAGRQIKCPACKETIIVPQPPRIAAPPQLSTMPPPLPPRPNVARPGA